MLVCATVNAKETIQFGWSAGGPQMVAALVRHMDVARIESHDSIHRFKANWTVLIELVIFSHVDQFICDVFSRWETRGTEVQSVLCMWLSSFS